VPEKVSVEINHGAGLTENIRKRNKKSGLNSARAEEGIAIKFAETKLL